MFGEVDAVVMTLLWIVVAVILTNWIVVAIISTYWIVWSRRSQQCWMNRIATHLTMT